MLFILGFGAQATRLCGGGVHDAWEQWMPDEVDNDTLLYAQAFAAVNHINFLDPDVYQSERWALKGQAIQAMRETLNDPEAAWNDGNIGAVLCMAVVAPLEVSLFPTEAMQCGAFQLFWLRRVLYSRLKVSNARHRNRTWEKPIFPLTCLAYKGW